MGDEGFGSGAPPASPTDDGGQGLLPGQGGTSTAPSRSATPTPPGQGQGDGQGQPAGFIPQRQYDELRASYTQTRQEIAEMRRMLANMNKAPAPMPGAGGGGRPSSAARLAEALGLDESGLGIVNEWMKEQFAPIQEQLEFATSQQERINFFQNNPDMRQYEPQFQRLEGMIDKGEMDGMTLKALAVRGAMADQIVKEAVANAKKEWEKTERDKIRASGGQGAGARPGASVEERVGRTQAVFNTKTASFSNKPIED